jgi:peptidoglycan/LPS O-acetylase OafA/YrhL
VQQLLIHARLGNMNIDFSEARNLKRFPFLDAARGLACVGVVAVHCDLEHHMRWYWGVMDFFFVMSGFLITRSLITNCDKGRGAPSFLLYRALRLLPAYMVVMLLYELLVLLLLRGRHSFETLPYILFYQNTDLIFGSVQKFPRVPEMLPYWSLVLEEQFYLLWGIFFCRHAYAKLRINLATLGFVVFLLGLGMLFRSLGVAGWTLPGRFDGFLLGSMAGIIIFMPQKWEIPEWWSGRLLRIGWVLSIAALLRLMWTVMLHYRPNYPYWEGHWIDVTCFSVVSVVLVLGMVKMDIRGLHFGRLQQGLGFIGLISYEIYLVHYPMISILKKAFDFKFNNGGITLFIVTMVLSSFVAYVVHKILTSPALRSRERIQSFLTSRFQPGTVPVQEACLAPVASEDRAGGTGR